MRFIEGTVSIETKLLDEERIMAEKSICDWADKHEMAIMFGWNEKGDYLCEYQKKGRTQAFCKGYSAEIKDLIKTAFNAKVKTIFEAW